MATSLQSRFDFEALTSEKFEEYHRENPQVYEALKRFALEAVQRGRPRMSINALFEIVRWNTSVDATGDSFKLNNNYRAYYARLLMNTEPGLRGFFETRKAKADKGRSE